MKVRTTIWVELVPVYYYSGADRPSNMKAGKILRRRPAQADLPRYVEVQIEVDNEWFNPTYLVEMTS